MDGDVGPFVVLFVVLFLGMSNTLVNYFFLPTQIWKCHGQQVVITNQHI